MSARSTTAARPSGRENRPAPPALLAPMVPKVAGKGKSFKGAGLYYLHDKKASTSERVAFTLTENLPTDDPELALRYMAYTAMRQGELKAAHGAAMTGRKLAQSVYTYSLSWAPGETPTEAEMIAAGRETLKVLGIEAHEILMVAHNDEPHPHLHLIVNRVHPETGIAAKLSNDHLELSKWAEGYERAQGKIRCAERVENNRKRRERKARKENGFVKHEQKINSADFRRWQKAQESLSAGPALTLDIPEVHLRQREALYDAKEQRIAQRRQAIKDLNRPKWAFLFRQQEQEKRELDRTRRSAFSRLLYWMTHRQEIGARGGLAGAFQALIGYHGPDFLEAMNARHEADRKALSGRAFEQTREAIAQENEQYRTDLDMLQRDQAEEREALRGAHGEQGKELERYGRKGGDEEAYRRYEAERQREETLAKPVRDQFEERVGRRIKRARKRDEQRRGKDAGRERDD